MKTTILTKILAITIILTIIPLATVGYLALQDEKQIGKEATIAAQAMGNQTIADSTTALTNLGVQIIQQKAEDVAKQLEIYIKSHPTATLADLQSDTYLKQIAVQPVGVTGYTSIFDQNTIVCYFHPNKAMINVDFHKYDTTFPALLTILTQMPSGTSVSGYYDWQDADGAIRQKFLYATQVNSTTADGVHLEVLATTYIDEFSSPVVTMSNAINESIEETTANIKTATESLGTQNTILFATLITMTIVVIASITFAISITKPIKQLTTVANKISNGDLNQEIKIKSNDEIRDLGESFERMINAFKVTAALSSESQEGQ